MVTESAIRVIEIARCLFSKQTKTTGPQWTTLPCLLMKTEAVHVLSCGLGVLMPLQFTELVHIFVEVLMFQILLRDNSCNDHLQ